MATYTTRLIVPCSLASLRTKPRSKSRSIKFSPVSRSKISKHEHESCFLVNHPSRYFSNGKRDLVVYNTLLPDVPIPSGPPSDSWKSWVLGAVITIIIPFFSHKWGPLFQMTKKIEAVVETVDEVAEVIEKVAKGAEKVADEIGDELPEDGKLRRAFDSIENAAKETANAANLVDEILDKVDEVEKEVEEVMEPANHQTSGQEKLNDQK
ncbi:hypothetical protein Vadar_029150 [Vaccinium darrowii]|uniref:Uncharacterized protein n=1 Tax=Vaccinium darrowii TaxID=229202 RepID=A0ACB7Y9W6_9ERIC|nr:hypothetical protein Vadar_029150 [Vaccinium darrowii]